MAWSLTLPVAPLRNTDSRPCSSTAPRTLSTRSAPTPPLSRSEAPSADESHLSRSFAGAENETVGPPLVPRLSRLGPASDARSPASLRARPDHLAGYSPELTRHAPPIDFCSCQDFRAQPRTARLRLHSSRRNESRRAGDSPALADSAGRILTARGSSTRIRASLDPRDGVRSASRGFTPTCSYPDTRCR